MLLGQIWVCSGAAAVQGAGLVPGGEDNAALRADQGRYLISSLIEEAITSSQLEGASTTRRVAEAMLREGRKPGTLSERMIFNNFEAMRRIRDICRDTLEPGHVIELQRVLTEGTLERPEDCGQLRTSDDIEIVAPNNDRLVLHRPPWPVSYRNVCKHCATSPTRPFLVTHSFTPLCARFCCILWWDTTTHLPMATAELVAPCFTGIWPNRDIG
ncbi:MAG: hypothetical protein Q8K35_03935 [Thiobacillus sp.]|nr:hypothetical protein [Thiobacillus sp.]MDP2056897.1 hypothetical protein [Thiobacillus sp.]